MPINVILDRGSFYPETYSLFQAIANQVVAQVNLLIPGTPPDVSEDDIVCLKLIRHLKRRVATQANRVNRPKTRRGTGRNERGYYPDCRQRGSAGVLQRFAFQLSHELAHVKMGPQIDMR